MPDAAAVGAAVGAFGGSLATGLALGVAAASPYLMFYVFLFGTLPGLAVGSFLGIAARMASRRRGRAPGMVTSVAVGAVGACLAALAMLAFFSSPPLLTAWHVRFAALVALGPGALCGYLWRLFVTPAAGGPDGLPGDGRGVRAMVAIVFVVIVQIGLMQAARWIAPPTDTGTATLPAGYPEP